MSDRHQSSEGCQIPSATLRHGRGAPEGARDHSTGKTSYLYQFIKSSLYKRSVEKSQVNTMREYSRGATQNLAQTRKGKKTAGKEKKDCA